MYAGNLKVFVQFSDKFIGNENIRVVVELGARDCRETVAFNQIFNKAFIYAFECNPMTIPTCREAVRDLNRVELTEKAVSSVDGKIKFYPIDPELTKTTWEDGNPGASSIFQASGKYPVETYVQKEIEVDSIRLDSFLKDRELKDIDILWMDIQGAELLALESLGSDIRNVKLIHTEIEFLEIYSGQPLFEDVYNFLHINGFYLIGFTHLGDYDCDAIFINRKILKNRVAVFNITIKEKVLLLKVKYIRSLKNIFPIKTLYQIYRTIKRIVKSS
ncbi:MULTISPECIES: FkbM family methyltransferase [Microcystis]|jgi:FkbM family methyltransferase|uniref:FkbM family methyltransferase n=1 Tax=Microcystis viridis FACHB-1342 TaxID=2692900 RepID=A0ABR8GH61_MICVR|nr:MULTISPECIES: FkbM family methyltransferase [Microcystis]MBD2602409.1 FkbM family methyltransferase [Microcystis viridis FACHB-1342]MDB9387250.1 FkbM family methyltransferase [Microcystis aeruginosa CS-583]ODV39291.1 hypothetical protein BFG60_1194 [Microcystis aeruginosa NIES-98]